MASRPTIDRRNFLTAVTAAGAASVAPIAAAAAPARPGATERPPAALRPTYAVAKAEGSPPPVLPTPSAAPGSDFMVDVIKSLKVEYVAANPSSSVRGLHESLIDYGRNSAPELLTCMHESSSVAMAHGYFKITGKPMIALVHSVVGLQNASMSIYNAWCDRVPVIVVTGNHADAAKRPPLVPTYHAAQDAAAMVRDFTKWDDAPASLPHFADSMVRAYRFAMTPPFEPVLLSLDADLQEDPAADRAGLQIPRYIPAAPPQGDSGAVQAAAKLLVDADMPVIVCDRLARTANGPHLLVQLAELLNAPVVDQFGRMNFPNTHRLSQTGQGGRAIGEADVILGLELSDMYNTVNAWTDNTENTRTSRVKPGTKLISITAGEFYMKSNFQDFQAFQAVDVAVAGDAEATLPALIEAVRQALPASRRTAIDDRGTALSKAWSQGRERTRVAASYAWDASPISTARLSAELWQAIKGEDWSLVSDDLFLSRWPHRLWPMDKHHNYIGGAGGYGMGYGAPAAVGAALANKSLGRFSVNLQCDGDLMYAPGVLWTAVHHKIPLLSVMHNNRGYHQETMHVQRVANQRDRVVNTGIEGGPLGTRIANPYMDYAKLAQSMGMDAIGPITDPAELAPAFKRAVAQVKAGEPVLIDVVTQPR